MKDHPLSYYQVLSMGNGMEKTNNEVYSTDANIQ